MIGELQTSVTLLELAYPISKAFFTPREKLFVDALHAEGCVLA